MLKLKSSKIRGDTLIEVLFATAAFSLVAVGGIAIMNKGTAASERALEITLVRNEINSQAETLRFLNASYIAAYQKGGSYVAGTPAQEWKNMRDDDSLVVSSSSFGAEGLVCPSHSDYPDSFILNTKKATYIKPSSAVFAQADTFSQIIYSGEVLTNAQGIWIEAVESKIIVGSNQNDAGYIDFHINACWYSNGQAEPVTIGTIVRLYEPRE